MRTPSQEVFDDMKQAAIKVWQTYDNEFGYVDEKLGRIESMKSPDDAILMYMMFDHINQSRMVNKLELDDSVAYIRECLY